MKNTRGHKDWSTYRSGHDNDSTRITRKVQVVNSSWNDNTQQSASSLFQSNLVFLFSSLLAVGGPSAANWPGCWCQARHALLYSHAQGTALPSVNQCSARGLLDSHKRSCTVGGRAAAKATSTFLPRSRLDWRPSFLSVVSFRRVSAPVSPCSFPTRRAPSSWRKLLDRVTRPRGKVRLPLSGLHCDWQAACPAWGRD